jgi:hypothetical protein
MNHPKPGGDPRCPALCANDRGEESPNGYAVTAGDRPDLTEGRDAGEGAGRGPDVLSSSSDEPWAEQRLRQALERSGAVAWTRRHRLLLGGLVAVLVVAAAGTGYLATRPPPADPVVRVSIVGFASGTTSDFDAVRRSRAQLTYQLTAHAAGDVDTAVGVVGPGLTRPTSSMAKVKFGLPRVGTLGATVDCTDSHWWVAKDADYRARVRRTDRYGRVTTYDAPLAQSGAVWHFAVRSTCLRTFARTLPPALGAASVVPGKHKVEVTLTLTNPSRHALWVQATAFGDDTATSTGGALKPLPAGGAASVEMSVRAVDCARGTPHVPFASDPQGGQGQDIALPVYLADRKIPNYLQLAFAWARLDSASTALVNRQLATLCPRTR